MHHSVQTLFKSAIILGFVGTLVHHMITFVAWLTKIKLYLVSYFQNYKNLNGVSMNYSMALALLFTF